MFNQSNGRSANAIGKCCLEVTWKIIGISWNRRVQMKRFWSDRHDKKERFSELCQGRGEESGRFSKRERGCLGFW